VYRTTKFKNFRSTSKLHNVRQTYNGYSYASKLEAKVAMDLDFQKKAGEIKDWQRQVKISLDVNGEHICNYYIDFIVEHNDGTLEYIEVKGLEMPLWKLKWKLFQALYKEKIQNGEIKLTVLKA